MEITAFTLWSPGLESLGDWQLWAEGGKEASDSAMAPRLPFASPIATRRLSQLTKMTVHCAYKLGMDADMLFFGSCRGEISAQLKLNSTYARTDEVPPALFSLSVFNTAPAEATILLKSQMPYSPVFSGRETIINNLLLAAASPLISGRLGSALAIYADEHVPDEYRTLMPSCTAPMAIGLRLSGGGASPFPSGTLSSPESLARYLLKESDARWA